MSKHLQAASDFQLVGAVSKSIRSMASTALICAFAAASSALTTSWSASSHAFASMRPARAAVPVASGALAAPPVELAVLAGGGGGGGNGRSGGRGGGGGGGDDDGEASEFLRLLNSVEQASVIEDWAARSRIYKMTDQPELRGLHNDHLDECACLPACSQCCHPLFLAPAAP